MVALLRHLPPFLRRAWFALRGIGGGDWRRVCGRCGSTGAAHVGGVCWRFRRTLGERAA